MHLANLTNEVIFKKVFTNVEVFTAFVKDVLGLDIEIDKVETERELNREAAHIRFRMDLFAESKDHRVIVGLSIHNPENPGINLSKPAIRKAAELFELDRIDPRELYEVKNQEARKQTMAVAEAQAVENATLLRIQNALRPGKHSMETIAELNEVPLAFVEQVAANLGKSKTSPSLSGYPSPPPSHNRHSPRSIYWRAPIAAGR